MHSQPSPILARAAERSYLPVKSPESGLYQQLLAAHWVQPWFTPGLSQQTKHPEVEGQTQGRGATVSGGHGGLCRGGLAARRAGQGTGVGGGTQQGKPRLAGRKARQALVGLCSALGVVRVPFGASAGHREKVRPLCEASGRWPGSLAPGSPRHVSTLHPSSIHNTWGTCCVRH